MSFKRDKMKDIFKKIIISQQEWFSRLEITPRNIELEQHANYIFTGLRRAGKSYVLYQVIQELCKDKNYEQIIFINFEDERLSEIDSNDLQMILDAYYELYDKKPILFFDEIQNVPHWQKFVRRLADQGFQLYISGSNANMLSSEIASTLGGRFIKKEILPLSFAEFLQFQKIPFSAKSKYTEERFAIKKAYSGYLRFGGFPELLRFENKRDYLSSVYQKLFFGDLIARYSISNVNVLRLLVKKMAESVNNETSVSRIKNLIKSTGAAIGSNTLFDYLGYLENSYLIASLSNYHSKYTERESSKKYYFLDTGILGLFLMDQDTKLLENQVYIELRRRGLSPYFLKRNTEVDFYVPDKNLLVQVAYSLDNPETYKREIKALTEAMKEFKLKAALILTYDEEKTIETAEGKIQVLPLWQWMLESK